MQKNNSEVWISNVASSEASDWCTIVYDVCGTELWDSCYFLFKIILKYKDWRQIHSARRMNRWEDTKRLTMIVFAVIIVIFIDMGKAFSDFF
jgi:hypothetical protein